jgi:hypothetical protein
MKRTSNLLALAVVLALTAVVTAGAKDAVEVSVSYATGAEPFAIVDNGAAVGTIQVYYTVNAFAFTPGAFGTLDIDMQNVSVNTQPPNPSYPVTLNLVQSGGGAGNLILSADPSSFAVQAPPWSDSSILSISIPSGASNDDGTTLIGNLNFSTPAGSQLGTITTINIHVTLVHPTTCLRLYNFVTQHGESPTLTLLQVNVNPQGKISGTSPALLSDRVLVANTCGQTESFKVKVEVDSHFDVPTTGNPVQTFGPITGAIDPVTFDFEDFGDASPAGTGLCVGDLSLLAGQSLLVAVRMDLDTSQAPSALPEGGAFNEFHAGLHAAGSTCNSLLSAGLVSPNPVDFSLPFTINQQGAGPTSSSTRR